jgi:hypothetical protein
MPLLFLNERSWATACDRSRANVAMADFVEAVRAVVKVDPDETALVSEVARESLEIAEGYTIGDWFLDDPKNRDRWRRLRALQNRSPVKSVYPAPDADGHLEYRHKGEEVLGLGAAHFMQGIAVSLPVAPEWTPASVTLERRELVELDDGSLEFEDLSVEVRHISVRTHVDDHLGWIRKARLARADSGRQRTSAGPARTSSSAGWTPNPCASRSISTASSTTPRPTTTALPRTRPAGPASVPRVGPCSS